MVLQGKCVSYEMGCIFVLHAQMIEFVEMVRKLPSNHIMTKNEYYKEDWVC